MRDHLLHQPDLLINFGGSIKSLEVKGDLVTVGDYGILWGNERKTDLAGDWFTKNTFLGARAGVGVDCLLHHGIALSPALKSYTSVLLPPTIKAEPDEHGLLVATVLDRRDAYQRKIYELTEQDAFSWSSGAINRAVKRRGGVKAGEIVQWPLMEFSFTPTPCEPRMMGIAALDATKSAPLDWFKAPSYAKAVRVLSDLSTRKAVSTVTDEVESLRQDLLNTDDGSDTWPVIFDALDAAKASIADDGAGEGVDVPMWDANAATSIGGPVNDLCDYLGAIYGKNNDDEPAVRSAIDKARTVLGGDTISASKASPPFDFCSTQCNLSGADADAVRAWSLANIPDALLAGDGREDTPHITVLYGLTDDNTAEVQARVGRFGPIEARVGQLDCFSGDEYDVVILRVDSLDLVKLNAALATLDHTSTHASYQPHITLAYVQPGQGAQFTGDGPLTGQTLSFDGFAFSDKDGDMTQISTAPAAQEKTVPAQTESAEKADEFVAPTYTPGTTTSLLFAYDGGANATASAIRTAVDQLTFGVLFDVLSPATPATTFGLTLGAPIPPELRLAYLETALDQFEDFVLGVAGAILDTTDDGFDDGTESGTDDGGNTQTPDEAAKSLKALQFTSKDSSPQRAKHATGLPFVDHSETVLAAAQDFSSRARSIVAMRASSRKAGRVLSKTNFDRLSKHKSSLQELVSELAQLLDGNEPVVPTQDDQTQLDPSPDSQKALEAVLDDAELRFKQMEFEMAALD